jgi:hypothetical protein
MRPPNSGATTREDSFDLTCLTRGRLWMMGSSHAVVYITEAAVACELLDTPRRNLDRRAMAVYYDCRGRAFAWQFGIPPSRWREFKDKLA